MGNLAALSLSTSTGGQCELLFRPGTSDEALIKQIFTLQEYSLERTKRHGELQALYQAHLARGERPLVLDLGANIGFATAYFSLAWPAAVVVAVEPEAENFALLEQNLARLKDRRLVPMRAAVASRPGELSVSPQAEPWAHTTGWDPAGAGQRVPAVTVPQLLGLDWAALTGSAAPVVPFLAKIDIEGFEADLFSVDPGWMDAFPLVIIELHDWLFPGRATSQGFLAAAGARDRDFVILGENVFSLKNPVAPR